MASKRYIENCGGIKPIPLVNPNGDTKKKTDQKKKPKTKTAKRK